MKAVTSDAHTFLMEFKRGERKASLHELSDAVNKELKRRIEEKLLPAIQTASKWVDIGAIDLNAAIYRNYISTYEFRANVMHAPDGRTHTINLWLGLPMFYFLIGRMLGTDLTLIDKQGTVLPPPARRGDDCIKQVIKFLDNWSSYNFGNDTRSMEEVVQVLESTGNEHEKTFANYCSQHVERFVIAHELGHIIADISPSAFPIEEFEIVAFETTYKISRKWERMEVVRGWAREYQADLIALRLLQDGAETPTQHRNCLSGAIVFFLGACLAEYSRSKTVNSVTDTHPPHTYRAFELIRHYQPLVEHHAKFVVGLMNQVERILKEAGWAGEALDFGPRTYQ